MPQPRKQPQPRFSHRRTTSPEPLQNHSLFGFSRKARLSNIIFVRGCGLIRGLKTQGRIGFARRRLRGRARGSDDAWLKWLHVAISWFCGLGDAPRGFAKASRERPIRWSGTHSLRNLRKGTGAAKFPSRRTRDPITRFSQGDSKHQPFRIPP